VETDAEASQKDSGIFVDKPTPTTTTTTPRQSPTIRGQKNLLTTIAIERLGWYP